MRLILLLSALLSAIAGYSPAAAARPVEAGQVLCVAPAAQIVTAERPANTFGRATNASNHCERVPTVRPLYADRLLI